MRAHYQALAAGPGFEPDPAQRQALTALESLAERIANAQPGSWRNAPTPPQGLWLWGPVGRGKTLLMDLFHQHQPETGNLRLHFHRFMDEVHHQLRDLSGHADPLACVADNLSARTRVLCFDEFYVSDIADAMILGRLMEQLFKRGVFLFATSNQHPDQLYSDGLQRQRFLPAIEQLKAHCQIYALNGDQDHRLRQLHHAHLFIKKNERSEDTLGRWFERRSGGACRPATELRVQGRSIPCRAVSDSAAWFHFSDLCEGPRSQRDYIELAERFHTLILSDIPALSNDEGERWVVQGTEDAAASATNQRRFLSGNDDRSRRFIALVDELYDRAVTLIASCEVGIDQLYPAGALAFAFERTRSRLLEMQSHEYLDRSPRHD